MPQIFVFTAGNREAQRHVADTIENQIDEEIVFNNFPPAHREDLESIQEQGNGFYAWGAVPGEMNIPRWEAMEGGDYALSSYGNAYHHAARVLAKYDNPRFAERVWGTDHEGRTWRYMYFLTRPVQVDRRVPEVADYLNAGYRGFTKIHPKKVDIILNEFGSVDEFIHQVLGGPKGGASATRVFSPVTQRDIEELDKADGLDRTEIESRRPLGNDSPNSHGLRRGSNHERGKLREGRVGRPSRSTSRNCTVTDAPSAEASYEPPTVVAEGDRGVKTLRQEAATKGGAPFKRTLL